MNCPSMCIPEHVLNLSTQVLDCTVVCLHMFSIRQESSTLNKLSLITSRTFISDCSETPVPAYPVLFGNKQHCVYPLFALGPASGPCSFACAEQFICVFRWGQAFGLSSFGADRRILCWSARMIPGTKTLDALHWDWSHAVTLEALRVVHGWASYWLTTAGLVMRLATCIALLLVASMHAGGSCLLASGLVTLRGSLRVTCATLTVSWLRLLWAKRLWPRCKSTTWLNSAFGWEHWRGGPLWLRFQRPGRPQSLRVFIDFNWKRRLNNILRGKTRDAWQHAE